MTCPVTSQHPDQSPHPFFCQLIGAPNGPFDRRGFTQARLLSPRRDIDRACLVHACGPSQPLSEGKAVRGFLFQKKSNKHPVDCGAISRDRDWLSEVPGADPRLVPVGGPCCGGLSASRPGDVYPRRVPALSGGGCGGERSKGLVTVLLLVPVSPSDPLRSSGEFMNPRSHHLKSRTGDCRFGRTPRRLSSSHFLLGRVFLTLPIRASGFRFRL